MQMAVYLRNNYDSDAILQAYLKIYEALEKKDISSCLFWNEVLKILDAKNEKLH